MLRGAVVDASKPFAYRKGLRHYEQYVVIRNFGSGELVAEVAAVVKVVEVLRIECIYFAQTLVLGHRSVWEHSFHCQGVVVGFYVLARSDHDPLLLLEKNGPTNKERGMRQMLNEDQGQI